jgi:hypothetical protein
LKLAISLSKTQGEPVGQAARRQVFSPPLEKSGPILVQDTLDGKLGQQPSARTSLMEAWYIQCFDTKTYLPVAQIEIDIFKIKIVEGRSEETKWSGRPDRMAGQPLIKSKLQPPPLELHATILSQPGGVFSQARPATSSSNDPRISLTNAHPQLRVAVQGDKASELSLKMALLLKTKVETGLGN